MLPNSMQYLQWRHAAKLPCGLKPLIAACSVGDKLRALITHEIQVSNQPHIASHAHQHHLRECATH